MTTEKKSLYIISGTLLAALVIALFAPSGSGRILAAILLLPGAAFCWLFLKKRPILSIHTKTVLLLISVMGLLYFVLYYMSGLAVGFTRTPYGLWTSTIFRFILPIGAIVVCSELVRFVLCAQHGKWGKVFAYLICLLSDVLISSNFAGVTNFSKFIDVVGLALLPSILYNLLYNYLTVRYGFWPNIIYKAFTVWVFYLIPYDSAISKGIVGLVNLFLPIVIYFFIDSLYEQKKRYALGRNNVFIRITSIVLMVVVIVFMVGTVMLISNHFDYGAYVVATGSMTGELNKGDIAIYERYEEQQIAEGQVIVFEHNGAIVLHRVVKKEIINGIARYYTKGDANDNIDAAWRGRGDIVGIVQYRLPYIGFPTLWLRSLFRK